VRSVASRIGSTPEQVDQIVRGERIDQTRVTLELTKANSGSPMHLIITFSNETIVKLYALPKSSPVQLLSCRQSGNYFTQGSNGAFRT
jgi:hypothetical protein